MFDGVSGADSSRGGYPAVPSAGLPSWLHNLGAFLGAGAVGGVVTGPPIILTQSADKITLGVRP
jgi:hypothetical protein